MEKEISFGYGCAWMALSTSDTAAVLKSFRLRNTLEVEWSEGIWAGQEARHNIRRRLILLWRAIKR